MNSINSRQFSPELGLQAQMDQVSLRQPAIGPQSTEIGQTQEAKGTGFFDALQKSMQETNADQISADNSIKDLIAGRSKNIHETMLAIQKADLSLKTMMQVRNKILEAYKEIIRMPV